MKELGLEKELQETTPLKVFTDLINDANRVPGRRRILYRKGPLLLERYPMDTGERFTVYRRGAKKGTPEYSPLSHDAPHYEGPKTPEGMREWASWYAFNKMDDGTYEAELDEAWWWGKPGGGAAATMTAEPSTVRYRRNGLICPTKTFWRK